MISNGSGATATDIVKQSKMDDLTELMQEKGF